MYKWMDYIVSPKVNAEVAEFFGEAPAQTLACGQTADKTHCDTYHALDSAYAGKIHYWATPQKQCLVGGGNDCTSYDQWVSKWQEIKG
jgi:putative spermidine/putrescine transport system substrate-binding protein